MTISKRFLVIGSNSFSGSHCVNELIGRGHIVVGISRSVEPVNAFLPLMWQDNNKKANQIANYRFEQIDLNKDIKKLDRLLKSYCPEIVINFASQGMVAQSWDNPTHWYQTNIVAQVALHDKLREITELEKYVHISTPEVYGTTNEKWVNESQVLNPSTPYAVSRAACDMHLLSYYKAYKFPVVFTRAANVYGPGQQLYRIIPRTILSGITGKKMNLHGGGVSRRSFIHIEDVIKATLSIADNGLPGSIWHISGNNAISIKQLVCKVCLSLNIEPEKIIEETKEKLGKDQEYLLSSEKIRGKLNWKDNISLDDGIDQTIKWVTSNIDLFKRMSWSYHHKQ